MKSLKQKRAHKLEKLLKSKFAFVTLNDDFTINIRLDNLPIQLTYLHEGVWGIDTTFSSNMLCYISNIAIYRELTLVLSSFNVASYKIFTEHS